MERSALRLRSSAAPVVFPTMTDRILGTEHGTGYPPTSSGARPTHDTFGRADVSTPFRCWTGARARWAVITESPQLPLGGSSSLAGPATTRRPVSNGGPPLRGGARLPYTGTGPSRTRLHRTGYTTSDGTPFCPRPSRDRMSSSHEVPAQEIRLTRPAGWTA